MALNFKKIALDFLGAASQDLIDESNKRISQLQETVTTQNKLLDTIDVTYKTDPSGLAIETISKETTQASGIRVNPVKLQQLYFNNQYIFRAVNVRANEIITRGFRIFGGDDVGLKKCTDLIQRSGDNAFFKQWSCNSVTKDTPLLIRKNGFIDIIEISELYKKSEFNVGRRSTQSIRDIEVLTDEGWCNIKYVFKHKVDEKIYKIRTGSGLAKVTHDHSLMCNKKEVHSKDLRINSKIDMVELDCCDGKYNSITKEHAWLLGFFVADGTAGKYKGYNDNSNIQWKISNKNIDFLNKASSCIKSVYNLNSKIYNYENISEIKFLGKKKKIVEWYLENCYTPNRYKRVPKIILNSSNELKEEFLKGYWAGDGSKAETWNVASYATDSFTLIAGIEYLLKSLGKSMSLYTVKNRENVYLMHFRNGIKDMRKYKNAKKLNECFINEFVSTISYTDLELSNETNIDIRNIKYYRKIYNIPTKKQRDKYYLNNNINPFVINVEELTNNRIRKESNVIEEIRTEQYNDYVYDIATENHKFVAGVGGLVHHNTDIWGSGWIEKNYSPDNSEIKKLSFIHPATFGWKTVESNDYIIDIGSDKQPVACEQRTVNEMGYEVRTVVDKKRIEMLAFNKVADEFIGVGIIQPIFTTITRLMEMEGAAANAAVKAANPVWVGIFDTVSEHTVRKWGYILGRLATKEQIFLPKGTDIRLISPERQLFSEYSEYYVDSVISGTGVPKSLLLGRGGDTNRAESVVHSRHFQSLIEANQDCMEYVINKIFKEYGELAGFEPPTFKFNEIVEDADLMSDKALALFQAGVISREEAREMIGLEEASENGTFNRPPAKSLEQDVKDENMKAWHPAKPGSAAGSQKNNKKDAKRDIATVKSPK